MKKFNSWLVNTEHNFDINVENTYNFSNIEIMKQILQKEIALIHKEEMEIISKTKKTEMEIMLKAKDKEIAIIGLFGIGLQEFLYEMVCSEK